MTSFLKIIFAARKAIPNLDFFVISVLLTVLFGFMLGSRPLSVPDEGRYVEIAREMHVHGNYLTPRLNGVKYFEKPPLFYWFETLLIKLFGLSEWSVRLGPALFALFGSLAICYAGMRLWDRLSGILAAVVLSTSVLYFALSRLITLDMPVSALLTAALLSFLLAIREQAAPRRRWFFLSFYVFCALATLTKGLIGVVFPGVIIFFWMLLTGEWGVLRSMRLISGAGMFLLIAAPWHLLVGSANPEFLGFYFVREHFQRYLSAIHHHDKPFWFFIPVLFAGLLPWSLFLVQAIRHNLPHSRATRNQRQDTLFLLLWAGVIFLFFSSSHSKLIPYVLPVLPPLALLIGKYLADAWKGVPVRGFGAGLSVLGGGAATLIVVLAFLMMRRPELFPQLLTPYLIIVAAVLAGGIVLTRLLLIKRGPKGAIVAMTTTFVLLFFAVESAAPHLDQRTVKPLALTLKQLLGSGDEVFAYRTYYQDLPVYLERRINVVDWTGEMEFGMTVEDTHSWMIDRCRVQKTMARTGSDVICHHRQQDVPCLVAGKRLPFYPVVRNGKTVIASNKER